MVQKTPISYPLITRTSRHVMAGIVYNGYCQDFTFTVMDHPFNPKWVVTFPRTITLKDGTQYILSSDGHGGYSITPPVEASMTVMNHYGDGGPLYNQFLVADATGNFFDRHGAMQAHIDHKKYITQTMDMG